MYESTDGSQRKLSLKEATFFLVLSILLNTLGNGLTVASNMGSPLWTASAANIAHNLNFNIGSVLIVYGILTVVVNTLILHAIEWHRIIGNLIFTIPYGLLVAFWSQLFRNLGVDGLDVWERLVITIVGICLLSFAISIYQRVNLILHPNDDMTNIIRFKYVHGNAAIAQYLNFAIPLIIIIILWLIYGSIVSFNIGTLISFTCQGPLIGWCDKHTFKHLHHRLTDMMQQQG